jgi:hypothetical protein
MRRISKKNQKCGKVKVKKPKKQIRSVGKIRTIYDKNHKDHRKLVSNRENKTMKYYWSMPLQRPQGLS